MWEDPIVAEVHRIREELAAQHNSSIKAMFAELRQRQNSLGERLVLQRKHVEPSANVKADCEESRVGPSSA